MAGAKPRKKKSPRTGHAAENRMINLVDQISAFADFKKDILPRLQKCLKEGWSPEQIYKEFADLAAARAVTIAVTEVDSNKALAATKEILDRAQGKATEHKNIKHELSGLSEEELDALLISADEEEREAKTKH